MGKQLAQPEVRAAIASPFGRGGRTGGEGVLLEDTMHILICDDDAVFAARVETLVRDFFARRGLQVECTVCHSGEETLARRDLRSVSGGAAGCGSGHHERHLTGKAAAPVQPGDLPGVCVGLSGICPGGLHRECVPLYPQARSGLPAAPLSGCHSARAGSGLPRP